MQRTILNNVDIQRFWPHATNFLISFCLSRCFRARDHYKRSFNFYLFFILIVKILKTWPSYATVLRSILYHMFYLGNWLTIIESNLSIDWKILVLNWIKVESKRTKYDFKKKSSHSDFLGIRGLPICRVLEQWSTYIAHHDLLALRSFV